MSLPQTADPDAEALPRPSFDRIARPYHLLEYITFGGALQRARLHYLAQFAGCRRALVLGDGDGRFTAALLAAHPGLEADAVDISASMLRLLKSRSHGSHPTAAARLVTHLCDARRLDPATLLHPSACYDLVITHFFLDCLTQPELAKLIAAVTPRLTPGAIWILSDFRIPPSGAMHLPARMVVRSLYAGFRILTGLRTVRLPDHVAALSAAGLIRRERHLSLAGLLTAELWQLPLGSAASHRAR